jgi:ABC-type multidrug transport system fused ATPase/permease subunit
VKKPNKLRILWSFLRPQRGALFFGIFLGIGAAGASLALPMSIKSVLQTLGTKTPLTSVLAPTAIFVLAAAIFGYGQGLVLGRLGERVVLAARVAMVDRLLHAKTSALSSHPGGELVARVSSDSTLLRRATAESLVGLTKSAVTLVGSVVLMFVLSPMLLAVTISGIGVIFVLVSLLMPGLAKANERAQEAVGHLGGTLDSVLRAIKTVKASRSEMRETARAVEDAEIAASEGIRAARIQTTSGVLAGIGSQLAIMIVLALGAWQISVGAVSVATLVAFLLYALQLVDPIRSTIDAVSELQNGVAAAARIAEIEAFDIEIDAAGTMFVPPNNDVNVAEFQGVTASYSPTAKPVVRDLNLRIPRRGHTAIVGPSGAGKTTVFTMLLRFLDISDGEIRLEGVPLHRWSLDQLRGKIVYVEQETPLLPGSLRYNVSYFRQDASDGDIWRALRAVRLDKKFEQVQNALESDLAATTMSGGERQRIALARALVAEPEILLLDEATAQLDGITETAVQQCIKEAGQRGAVVTIAHRLSTVIDADLIIVMEKGAVRAAGTHNELMARDELYRDLIAALRIGPAQPGQEQEKVHVPQPRPQRDPASLARASKVSRRMYARPSTALFPSIGFNLFQARSRTMVTQDPRQAPAPVPTYQGGPSQDPRPMPPTSWMNSPTRPVTSSDRRY